MKKARTTPLRGSLTSLRKGRPTVRQTVMRGLIALSMVSTDHRPTFNSMSRSSRDGWLEVCERCAGVPLLRRSFAFFIIGCALVTHTARLVPAARQTTPNALLVTIDTIRADRIGAYGHKPAHTPIIDQLAREGVRFTDATAQAPLTYPSHVAILTGRYPGAFGIRLNGMTPLPDGAVTLAERMRAAAYRTGAVIGSVIVDRSSGLSQGFDDYDDHIAGTSGAVVALADLQRSAGDVTRAAAAWIAKQRTPWFLWVHYYDPHLPYSAPARRDAPADPYDAEIAYVDEQLGVLLRGIDRAQTAIVVTGDHGEALGDHGEEDHGYSSTTPRSTFHSSSPRRG